MRPALAVLLLLAGSGCTRSGFYVGGADGAADAAADRPIHDEGGPSEGGQPERGSDQPIVDQWVDQSIDEGVDPDLGVEHYLQFDDTGEYVLLDDPISWSADFSASLKIRLDAAPGEFQDFISCFAFGGGVLSGWELGFESGSTIRWWIVNREADPWPSKCARTAESAFPLGEWHRVTFVFDYHGATQASYRLYVDGELAVSMLSPGASDCTQTMEPGPLPDAVCRLGGMDGVQLAADDLRVFDHALTDEEIGQLVAGTAPGGVVLHWPLNEGSGDVVHDASGNGHTGTAQAPAWQTY